MILQLSVKNQSIESSGITNDYKEAICEYVWNGFDAKATVVNIDFEIDNAELDTIKNIRITDNGFIIHCRSFFDISKKSFVIKNEIQG